MNPTAIYSKSGKGVQEASGKTSLLKRSDRAVLSAIDGRATLAAVAEKVGKEFNPEFQQLVRQLDKDGFIREVSPGSAAAPTTKPAPGRAPAKAPPAKAAAAKPSPKEEPKGDLDFSSLFPPSKPAPSKPPPSPPSTPPPKEQESALFKARQEAEAKAQADRERARADAEVRVRAEAEEKMRADAERKRKDEEAKRRAEGEEKIKAAREAAARAAVEAKAKAEAEALRVREEAERRAREEAERLRREAEEHARRVREEAERQAREEAERVRRELEAERRKLDEERRRREEEARREQAERAARRKREEEEEARERAAREARRKQREDEEAREAEEKRAARAAEPPPPLFEFDPVDEPKPAPPPAPAASPPPAAGGGFADNLLADLDAFTNREEIERQEKAEATRKAKAEAEAQRAREEAARREKEQAEARKREKEERRRREEEEAREREEAAQARMREEEERRRQEAEQRQRKAKEEEALAARATRRSAEIPTKEDEIAARRRRMEAAGPARQRRRRSWGKPLAAVLAVTLVAGIGAAHVLPLHVQDYERIAAEALGRPVRIGSARLWLFTGPQLRLQNVNLGEGITASRVMLHPSVSMLYDTRKVFRLVEVEGLTLPQDAIGDALLARVGGKEIRVEQIAARRLQLPGPMPLPKGLEADVTLARDGSVRVATLRGPEGLVARIAPKGLALEFDMTAASFTLPVAPGVSLTQFGMKGAATRQGMKIDAWDGVLLDGTLSGTAQVRWGGAWAIDGAITARGINAAVFAPALLSEGRAEGSGRFSMHGVEPAKLAASGRIEGNFTVNRGVLGSFDLSRAIQTGGRQAQGRTQFAEMNGHVIYEGGAVALRNVNIGAGALNAGAVADIAPNGALSGRIVADVRTVTQTLRATLLLGGTVREPQVRN